MDINTTRVNRLLMTMAPIGLTMQDEHRRVPGRGIHALAAQAIRGSALFSPCVAPSPERHAPKDIVVALEGVLWEDQIIYIYHSTPGSQGSQALAGSSHVPCTAVGTGVALLAAKAMRR